TAGPTSTPPRPAKSDERAPAGVPGAVAAGHGRRSRGGGGAEPQAQEHRNSDRPGREPDPPRPLATAPSAAGRTTTELFRPRTLRLSSSHTSGDSPTTNDAGTSGFTPADGCPRRRGFSL